MIYVASLQVPVKRAFADRSMSTDVKKIIELMSMDPVVSGMNAVVLGPKDTAGLNRPRLQNAINNKHKDVCVIYIYQKEKDGDLLQCANKELVKKLTPDNAKEIVEKYLSKDIDLQALEIQSRDALNKSSIEEREGNDVAATGVKGVLLKKINEENIQKEYKPEKVKREIYKDEVIQLYYYLNENQERVYCDPITEEPLPQSVIDEAIRKSLQKYDDMHIDVEKEKDEVVPEYELPEDKPEEVEDLADEESNDTVSSIIKEDPETESSLEKNLGSIRDFHDWELFKDTLNKDAVMRELLHENATFAGTVQMLSVLDAEIRSIFYDKTLLTQEKFDKIMEIGNKRAALTAEKNNVIADKIISIINTMTRSAKLTVEDVLYKHRKAVETLTTKDANIADETEVTKLIHKRCQSEIELLALVKHIIALYQAMDLSVDEVIKDLDASLPSDNKFINNMIGAAGRILTPANSKALARRLMTALQENRESMALLEREVYNVIDAIRLLLEEDKEIIERQQYMIRLLKAHRVEDMIVVDTVLKYALRLFVGAPQSGRTATALTWSGVQSRRANTILIDMTGASKLRDYGVEPISLDEFINQRIERPLCIIDAGKVNLEDVYGVVSELKTRLDYYAYINVLLDASDYDKMEVMSAEALSISFITNCTRDSLGAIKESIKHDTQENVARRVIMVDPPMNVLDIMKYLEADPTNTQCIAIPNIPSIREYAITGVEPYNDESVRTIFEDAFR